MSDADLEYRGKEFALASCHLFKNRLNYPEKIDLVSAIYDKARRTFKKEREHLFNYHPAAFGLLRVHYVCLGKTLGELLALKQFANEGAAREDLRSNIDSAMEDIVGMVCAFDMALSDTSSH